MLRVSHGMKKIAQDSVLWKHILLKKYPKQICFGLGNRPERLELAERNILKSTASSHILAQRIRNGSYINGPFSVNAFRLDADLRQAKLKRRLKVFIETRPTLEELGYNCDY